jgi:dihydroorotase
MFTIEGQIVSLDKTSRGRIEIGDDGLISSVGKETGSADLVLKDELIFPGFIDIHVHARECADHSQDYKEDFTSAGLAAINGGVVAFADMPNNPVAPVDEKSYAEKYELAKKSAVDVLLYAGIGPKTEPLRSVPIYRLSETPINGHTTGTVPYKVFMGKSVGDLFFENFEQLENILEKYSGQNVSFHCEDPDILEANKNQSTHENQRPPEAEVSAVDFALKLIEKYNLVGKICHCSNKESLLKLTAVKNSNNKITVEVTPHHLYFDETMMANENRKMFQVNPPIRQSSRNRLELIKALKNGDIDYLATDHAPHTIAEKEKGISGMPYLDTFGPFITWLIKEHGFTAQDILRVCSSNPGKFISEFLPNKYGIIEQGFAGSLTILDMNKPITISKSMLKTKAGWSPFEGVTFPGSVTHTIIRGKIYKA